MMKVAMTACVGVVSLVAFAGGPEAGAKGAGGQKATAPRGEEKATLTKQLQIAHVTGSGLAVTAKNGGVTIRKATEAGAKDVVIRATLKSKSKDRLETATVHADRAADGTLKVWDEWKDRDGNDECGYEIEVPDASMISVESVNGGISIENLSGKADVTTHNGGIRAQQYAGVLTATTKNGGIDVSGVKSGTLRAENGGIVVRLAEDESGPITALTTNGGVSFHVPKGFGGTIEAVANQGRIRESTGRGKSLSSKQKGGKVYTFGAGPTSSVKTTNGSIEIVD